MRPWFYSPPGSRHCIHSLNAYAVNWTFRTPEWMRDEPFCLRKLHIIRSLEAAALIATLLVVVPPSI